jgi:two-component system cell cycle response regulator
VFTINYKSSNLFISEDNIIDAAESTIKDEETYLNPLFAQFEEVTLRFKKTLNLTKKLIKISDGQQEYLRQIENELRKEIEERKTIEEKLTYFATMDVLTDVYNRRSGLLLLENQLKLRKRKKNDFCVCFIDVNGLKQVNDAYGHQEGDDLILTICNLIKQNIRQSDVLFRIGGDEFSILFPDCLEDNATIIMEKILSDLKEISDKMNKPYPFSFSYGIVEVNEECEKSSGEIIEIADHKMYEQKRKYRASLIKL